MEGKSIRVAVRVRPLLANDGATGTSLLQLDPSRPNEVLLASGNDRRAGRRYTFDQVFGPDVPQDELYGRAGVSDMVSSVVGGYHATVFAYGQTGSGKTYTMEGYRYVAHGSAGSAKAPAAAGAAGGRGGAARAGGAAAAAAAAAAPQADFNATPDEQLGLTPRAVRELFAAAGRVRDRRFTIRCSFVQIYREQVYDLLNPASLAAVPGGAGGAAARRTAGAAVGGPLRMRWSSQEEFYLENLFTPEVETAEEAIAAFQAGVANKVMSSHRLNAASSRSHCLFTLHVASSPAASPLEIRTAKLTLVDLAGSERAAHTGATEGALRDESVAINKSLFTLRQVITALTDATAAAAAASQSSQSTAPAPPSSHVPYRDSKLTCLLKHSLGGNSLTLMLACLSPADRFLEENASTLDYAARARRITNQVVVNEDPRNRLIRELRAEVAFLRQQLEAAGVSTPPGGLPTQPPLPGWGGSSAAKGTAAALAAQPPLLLLAPRETGGGSADAEAEASYARRLHEAAASDVEALVRSVIEASRVAVAASSAAAGLRAAYARSSSALETLRTEYDTLRAEDVRLRDRLAMLEALVSDGAVAAVAGPGGRPAVHHHRVSAAGGGSEGAAAPWAGAGGGGGSGGGAVGEAGGGGGWYTASAAALIELEELRRENALLHERLQLLDPLILDPGGSSGGGGGGGGGGVRGNGPGLRNAWAGSHGASRPGTGAGGGGGLARGGGAASGTPRKSLQQQQQQSRQQQQQQQRALSAGALRPSAVLAGAGGSGAGGRAQLAAAAAAAANPFTPYEVMVAVMPANGGAGGRQGGRPPTSGSSSAASGGGGGGSRTLTVDQLRGVLQQMGPSGCGGGGGADAAVSASEAGRPLTAGGGSGPGRLAELGHVVASRALTSGVRLSTTGKLLPAAPARMAVDAAAAGGVSPAPAPAPPPPVQLMRPPHAALSAGSGGGGEGAANGAGSTAAAAQAETALAALLAERNALTRQRLASGV